MERAFRPSLCLDTRALHTRAEEDVGVTLYLKSRPDGTEDPRNDDDAGTDAGKQLEPYVEPLEPAGLDRLTTLITELEASDASGLRTKWAQAVVISMDTKEAQYTALIASMYDEIRDQHAKVTEFIRLAKLPIEDLSRPDAQPAEPPSEGRVRPSTALADADEAKWELAKDSEGPFQRWRSLISSKASLEVLRGKAMQRKRGIKNSSGRGPLDLPTQRTALIESLKDMKQYGTQSKLLDTLVDIVRAFIANPVVSQNAFVNMILMGDPGTGKTRMARSLAQVLGSLGMFIYGGEDYVEAGRSDFIAQYEGQTAVKSRTFLLSNLEKVIFLDEAYSLTKYDNNGELEAYGAESTTEIVAFLSQYVGKIAMLCAGYKDEMESQFIPANDGLTRRFPYQMVLENYTGKHMVSIFIYSLWEALKKPESARIRAAGAAGATTDITLDQVKTYLSVPAEVLLADVCDGARQIVPKAIQQDDPRYASGEISRKQQYEEIETYPELNSIFSAQAGAMVNLANVTAILLMANKNYDKLGIRAPGVNSEATYYLDYKSMYNVILTMLQRSLAGTVVKIEEDQAPSVFTGGAPPAAPPYVAPIPLAPAPPPGGGGVALAQVVVADDSPMDDFLNAPAAPLGARLRAVKKDKWRVAKGQLDTVLTYYGWFIEREGGLYYWKMGDNVADYVDTEYPIVSASPSPSVVPAVPPQTPGQRRGRSGGAPRRR